MRKRTPTIATKLAAIDHIKFEQFCRVQGKTKTEIAREVILFYLQAKTAENIDEHQCALEKRLQKMENRISGLLVKLGIGLYGLEHLLWLRTDSEVRSKIFAECYTSGVNKMRTKLKDSEEELRQAMGD